MPTPRTAPHRARGPSVLAVLGVAEIAQLRDRLGSPGVDRAHRVVAQRWTAALPGARLLRREPDGTLVFSVPSAEAGSGEGRVGSRLERANVAAARPIAIGDEHVQLTPVVGWVPLRGLARRVALHRARLAADEAGRQLDLLPTAWSTALEGPGRAAGAPAATRRWRTPFQVLVTFALGTGVPLLGYLAADRAGIGPQVASTAYTLIVTLLLAGALAAYGEGLRALEPVRVPAPRPGPLPRATAIIAAYLPNESATIVDTVEAFLAQRYPGLQILLAYNTPRRLPVEQTLARLAQRDPRLVVLPVPGSTSKAQNVNAALAVATGEIIGIFDADHHPAPGAFERAARWLRAGYGVVQGHCVVRNGDASWVARTVAVEFEQVYAVSHPGRAALHGFGVFGGSNGFWRADLLRSVRMRASMLTEDIDASMRVVLRGERIASDPGLLATELAPTRLRALGRQRLRWAQGWTQVSHRYLPRLLASPVTTRRQKLGALVLLGWREVQPWLSLQILPLLAFVVLVPAAAPVRWWGPALLLTTVVTVCVGPVNTVWAYLLAAPDIRRHGRWFVLYLLVSAVFYTEFRNTVARVAQLKELMGERTWRVTTRAEVPTPAAAAA